MLRIFYDYQIFSAQQYGGISRYFCELATNLMQIPEIDPLIFAPLHINQYLRHCPSDLARGKRMASLPVTFRARRYYNMAVSALFLRHRPADIIHETYYGRVGLARGKSKCVLTVFDMIHEKLPSLFCSKDYTAMLKAKAARRADHIICISKTTKQDLMDVLGIADDKISVVFLASSMTYKNSSPPGNPRERDPYILYVGNRDIYKNFPRLLKSYTSSPRLVNHFRLLCFGGVPFSEDEKKTILSLNLPHDRITHISGNDDLLAEYYKNASAFVYPSLYEGFGIPLVEAMACHCPIVCSNTGSFPEVAGEAAEFFDPYDIDDIGHALESVLYSSDRAQELIKLGMERSRTFSWRVCAEETARVYRALA